MSIRHFGILVTLAAFWGASFLFIRVAAPALGPLFLMNARVLVAGLVLLAIAVMVRRPPQMQGEWWRYLLLGTVNSAIPFTLIATAELHLSASLSAVLNATTPLFSALVAALWLGDRLTPQKLVGLLLGLAGVTVAVGWTQVSLTSSMLLSVGASLLAAICYAIGAIYARRTFRDVPPLTLSIGQLLGAGIALLPLTVWQIPAHAPSAPVLGALAALTLLSTSVAYLLYFYLLNNVGPTPTLSVTFLVPVFGIFWGRLLLSEQMSIGTWVGLGLILASISLVTGMWRPGARKG